MIRFCHLVQIAAIVFFVTLCVATWSLFLAICDYAYVIFSLPVDAWERAKIIEQQLTDEERG